MTVMRPIIGGMERISRAFIGAAMILSAFAFPPGAEWFARLIIGALYPLLTALTAWDPVYAVLLGIKDRFAEYLFFR